jgi:phosphotransferase family enzyme
MSQALEKGLAPIVTQPAALAGDADLRVVYVRRKPARGLLALHAGRRRTERMACVSVDERALREGGGNAPATLSWFPNDPELRVLAACCEPKADGRMWEALERAGCRAAGSEGRLIAAHAEPLRYKPHDRCVLRYRLVLARTRGGPVQLSVVGKAYHEPHQARRAHAVAEQLHRGGAGVVAQPLGVLDELGVAFAEDVSASLSIPGGLALRVSSDATCPERQLDSAAAALAAVHACSPRPACSPRSAAREAAKLLERVDLLARSVPSLAARLRGTGDLLAEALLAARAGDRCLVHGSFKPSQLLFGEDARVVLTDLDHCCLADPALDLGYFLAYLRPAALWRGDVRARRWYEAAASRFRDAYAARIAATGLRPAGVESALSRSAVYEAALLIKIATRRVHRLNSPRPHELGAILNDAMICLGAAPERVP